MWLFRGNNDILESKLESVKEADGKEADGNNLKNSAHQQL